MNWSLGFERFRPMCRVLGNLADRDSRDRSERPSRASEVGNVIGMRPQPLIGVTDVRRSSEWYQRLLGCRSNHGGDEYEQLVSEGQLILQLHDIKVGHHHGAIGNPATCHMAMAYCYGLRWTISKMWCNELLRWALPLSFPSIETLRMATGDQTIGSAGCGIRTAIQ